MARTSCSSGAGSRAPSGSPRTSGELAKVEGAAGVSMESDELSLPGGKVKPGSPAVQRPVLPCHREPGAAAKFMASPSGLRLQLRPYRGEQQQGIQHQRVRDAAAIGEPVD